MYNRSEWQQKTPLLLQHNHSNPDCDEDEWFVRGGGEWKNSHLFFGQRIDWSMPVDTSEYWSALWKIKGVTKLGSPACLTSGVRRDQLGAKWSKRFWL